MGVVYKARDVALQRLVALKMVYHAGSGRDQQLARFEREARAVAQLQHPHIVQIFALGQHEGMPYFAMELMEGGSLSEKLRAGPFPVRESAQVVESLARAVHFAHQRGFIHRDIKPSNVLLTADGTPKITDFGLAKRFNYEDPVLTLQGAVVGTPAYMAPEQVKGHPDAIGPAIDVFGLGAMLYDLLTGQPPFRAPNVMETLLRVMNEKPVPPSQLRPEVPGDLELICVKCLEKDPARRYASAEALADDLARFLAGTPISCRPTTIWERLGRLFRRRGSR
jgi:serine/threonine-protein kinase